MHAHQSAPPWPASLDLRFERREASTILSGRHHCGPLQVQKALYPEGPEICHVAILHPPGGIAANDRLSVAAELGPDAHAVLTTPGATKWYRSNEADAQQHSNFSIGENALLEWLPRENILFDGSLAVMSQEIHLARGARYLGWEVLCFGRRASGEQWKNGGLRLNTRVRQNGVLLWSELADVSGGSGFAGSPAGLAGHSVSATLLAAGVAPDADLLAGCRELPIGAGGALTGISWLPGVLLARYLGDSCEQAFFWFTALWRLLRPAIFGTRARPLRLWAC